MEETGVSTYTGLLTELCIALNKLKVQSDYRTNLTDWLKKLSTTMHASDNLSERDVAQLLSDVQQSYTVFSEDLS